MARSFLSSPSIATLAAVAAVLVSVLLSASCTVEAYASSSSMRHSSARKVRYSPLVKAGRGVQKRREDGSAVTLYLFPTPPLNNRRVPGQRSRKGTPSSPIRKSKTSLPAMSDSVLATCDTLPAFHTAHGMLSPEVVMRIADTAELELGGPLHKFLKAYKSKGPMACLPYLSDPSVLPELTKAMRDIA